MKSGFPKKFGVALIAGLLNISSTIVHASVVDITFAGTVVSGNDVSGIFSPAGTNLAGTSYVSHYLFDTNLGIHAFDGAVGFGLLGERVVGGTSLSATSPALAASITINGVTFSVNGSYDAGVSADCIAPCTPGSQTGFGATAIGSPTGPEVQDIFETTNLELSRLVPLSYSFQSGDVFFGQFADSVGGTALFLAETTVTVSETPLPAAFPLFASGAAFLGLLGRRRKRKAARVA